MNKKELKQKFLDYWETQKMKTQIELIYQTTVFRPKAEKNLEEIRAEAEEKENELKKLVDDTTYQARQKKKELEREIKKLNEGVQRQEQELRKIDAIERNARYRMQEAEDYIRIIKNL